MAPVGEARRALRPAVALCVAEHGWAAEVEQQLGQQAGVGFLDDPPVPPLWL